MFWERVKFGFYMHLVGCIYNISFPHSRREGFLLLFIQSEMLKMLEKTVCSLPVFRRHCKTKMIEKVERISKGYWIFHTACTVYHANVYLYYIVTFI